jgi:hypothetical protein
MLGLNPGCCDFGTDSRITLTTRLDLIHLG